MTKLAAPSMNVSVNFRHTEPTEALTTYATEKVHHCLEKYVRDHTDVHIVLCVEKRDQIAEATVHSKNYDLRARAVTTDLYSAIDKLVDNIVSQLRKQKERQTDHRQNTADAEF